MLTVFGSPGSQPTRSIYWACLMKGLRFKAKIIHPAESRQYGNPRGQIPWIEDNALFLTEMPAILCFLADEHDWAEMYPVDPRQRAHIHQYLHSHHMLVRLCTYKMMANYVVKPLVGPYNPDLSGYTGLSWGQRELIASAMNAEDHYSHGRKIVASISDFLEQHYLQEEREFLCGFERCTIADLACYEEIFQLQEAGLFEYSSYPKLSRWLGNMSRMPFHDAVHRYNLTLGNIFNQLNNKERFTRATEAGLEALVATGLVTVQSTRSGPTGRTIT